MDKNRNISIASKNGYSLAKVKKAKEYLDEIGSNRRNFDFATLVGYYNDIYGTHELPSGCKCQSPKYYNGLQNFYKFGKLTLIANGLATEADFEDKKEEEPQPIENAENRINLGTLEVEPIVEEEAKEEVVEEPKKKSKKSK